jgi:hypothetical protein
MRSGDPMDGMYFLLLFVPFFLSVWAGDLLKKRLTEYLILDLFWSQNFSSFVGYSVQALVMLTGVLSGYVLIKLM